jgi:plasmid stabilization system protein ParE
VIEYEILIKPGAELDAVEISDWYENELPGLGQRFLENYVQTLRIIERNAKYCLNLGDGYRRAHINRFPYNVYFLIEENKAIILGILHQHRDPEEWQKRKF